MRVTSSMSDLTTAASCSGVEPSPSTPAPTSLLLTSGSLRMDRTSSLRPGDSGRRCLCRNEHADDGSGFETGQGFGNSRQLRNQDGGFQAGDRQRPQSSRFQMRRHGARDGEHHLHLTADEIHKRLTHALVGHAHDIQAGGNPELFTRQVIGRALRARPPVHLARPALRIGDEFLDRLDRYRGMHYQHAGARRSAARRAQNP